MEFAKHVHIKPLTGETDWPVWKRKMKDVLDYQEGAIDIIEGTLEKPGPLKADASKEETKEHKLKCDLFRKANSFAKSMISSAVSDAVYQRIMDKVTAHEAWEALKQQFEGTSQDQLFKVCAEFFEFGWTSGEDVSTHLAKIRTLWNELNNGLKSKNETELPGMILIYKVLHILPNSFDNFKSSWMLLSKDEAKTFDELSLQLLVYERNRSSTHSANNDIQSQDALFAKSRSGYSARGNRANSRPFSQEDQCNYCQQKGHWVSRCPKWFNDGCPSRSGAQNAQAKVTETEAMKIAL
ncbi:hypothetical protein V9T40_000838 [Parthenolecanium corni]|uniref:Gag protein n=1 Tax=Parthenolecanium corni TaxID=536013 RepID=A0AAN9TDP6_9HEMI